MTGGLAAGRQHAMHMVVSYWSASPWVLAPLVLIAAVHLHGLRGLAADARRAGRRGPTGLGREAAVFYLGMLAVALALVSPVGYWAQRFVWVRSAQDLLLAVVAPALVVLGAPWLALRRGMPLRPRPRTQERRAVVSPPEEAMGWLRLPIALTVAFNAAWCGWHVPFLYDAGRTRPVVFAGEVATYLGAGVLFWLQLIGSRPHVPRLAPARRAVLVVAAAVVGSGLAMVLVFGSGVLYPGYRGSEHHALSVVADQQVGGAVLWVIMLVPYSVVLMALLIRWLNQEESAELAAGLNRLLKPAKPAWPSRPGVR